ncbi:MAG: murein L,D-transpeptidase [Rhodobiaceae bacterium]|nr:murein L,D-transpeptidase [Rhodobiaceae bacterium]
MRNRLIGAAAACSLAVSLAACDAPVSKDKVPLGFAIKREMDLKGMTPADPIMVRIFKEESKLEVWKRTKSGNYKELKTYDICRWSGELGPKQREGDKQAPEGFYTVTPGQMNPNSSYHLSFNLGYPNTFDRTYGRTGAHLMVHGDCLSAGCYAMKDGQIEEIYALAREAFKGGQKSFQVQAMPFRMTPENIARHRGNQNVAFWQNLKEGNDHFEVTGVPPQIAVCGKKYVFNAQNADLDPSAPCPELDVPENIRAAVAQKSQSDAQAVQVAIARLESGAGEPPVQTNVQVAQSSDTPQTVQAVQTESQDGSGTSLMSRIPTFRIPGFGGGQRPQTSPVATATSSAVTGYTSSVDAVPVEDPFAVFDLFVTVDARTLPKTAVGARRSYEDPAGTR